MRPSSGSVRPAMQSSREVLPAPDAPNRIVKPASARKWTFKLKVPWGFGKRLRIRTSISEEIGWVEAGDAVCSAEADFFFAFTATAPPPTAAGSSRKQSTIRERKQ